MHINITSYLLKSVTCWESESKEYDALKVMLLTSTEGHFIQGYSFSFSSLFFIEVGLQPA